MDETGEILNEAAETTRHTEPRPLYDVSDPRVRALIDELGAIQQRTPTPRPIRPGEDVPVLTNAELADLDRRIEITKELDRIATEKK